MTDNSLLRFRKNQKYIVYDFETEGLNLRYSKPWQLGFIIAEGKKVKESYDLYIDFEDLNISDDARRLTGFSDTVYNKKKQDKQKVLDIFDVRWLRKNDHSTVVLSGINISDDHCKIAFILVKILLRIPKTMKITKSGLET